MAKSNAVIRPNLGIYYDRPRTALNPRMLADGLNFRVRDGKLTNLNLGWQRFEDFTLNGPVLMIASLKIDASTEILIFATRTDLYKFNSGSSTVDYITPRYEDGTASASGTAVSGNGTAWDTNAKAGDEISFGATGETDPDATWYEIDSVGGATSITLTTDAGTVADGAYTLRRKFSGDVDDLWDYQTFVNAGGTETQFWATNGIDAPVRWNGTDDQAELMTSLGFTCKTLAVMNNMMLFANITQSGSYKPTDLINSDVGDPSDVSSGLSEQFSVIGSNDPILAIKKLGDSIVIYARHHIVLGQFVGGDLVFVFRTVSNNVGILASKAVVDFGDYHEFIGEDTQYRFNGASMYPVNGHIWREVLRQQDISRGSMTYSFIDNQNGEVIWVMPMISDPNSGSIDTPPSKAFVEHYLEDLGQTGGTQVPNEAYSARSFPFTSIGFYFRLDGLTWDQISDAWEELNFRWNDRFFGSELPLVLVGKTDGTVFTLNTAQNANGVALESYVQFGRRAVGDARMRGLVARVYPFLAPFSTAIDITLLLYDHAGAQTPAISHTETYDQSLQEGDFFVAPYRRGRFMELKFGTTAASRPWEIEGYDLDVRTGGKR